MSIVSECVGREPDFEEEDQDEDPTAMDYRAKKPISLFLEGKRYDVQRLEGEGDHAGHRGYLLAFEGLPRKAYTAYLDTDGRPYCTCPDHQYRRREPGSDPWCKHLKGLRSAGLLPALAVAVAVATSEAVEDEGEGCDGPLDREPGAS